MISKRFEAVERERTRFRLWEEEELISVERESVDGWCKIRYAQRCRANAFFREDAEWMR